MKGQAMVILNLKLFYIIFEVKALIILEKRTYEIIFVYVHLI